MSEVSATLQGRVAAERRMVDRCTIRRPSTIGYDAANDRDGQVPGEVVYAGPCEVKPRDNADRVVEAAGETVSLWPYIVKVPVAGTEDLQLQDEVTVDAAGLDPALVDLVLRVRDVPRGSLRTARRLGCEVQS